MTVKDRIMEFCRMSGIKPDRIKIYVYMLSGACAARMPICRN